MMQESDNFIRQEKEEKLEKRMRALRLRAERAISPGEHGDTSNMSSDDIAFLVYELETHQIELEMQNKELFLTQNLLTEVRDEYRHLYENSPAGYLTTDIKGCILKCNSAFADMLALPVSQIHDRPISDFINYDYQDNYYRHRIKVVETHEKQSCTLCLKTPTDEALWVRLDSIYVEKQQDEACHQIRSVFIDITERKQAEFERDKLYQAVESSPSAIFITNFMGVIEYTNTKFTEITGYTSAEAIGQTPRILQSGSTPPFVYEDMWNVIKEGEDWYGKLPNRKKDGTLYWARNCISSVKTPRGMITHFVAIQDDVTHEKELSEELSHQASHDTLTGLINRYEFQRRAEKLLLSIGSQKSEHALCFMDLDQFKVINDSCGHIAGDQLLSQLSGLLKNTIRQHDTIARLGGDEFGVLLKDCSVAQAHGICNSILQAVQDFNFSWENKNYNVGISIGLVALNRFSTYKEALMRADTACYSAKDLGRNRIQEYRSEDDGMAMRRVEMRWVARINQALKEGRFRLYAQGIIAADGGQARHFEVLIRKIDTDGNEILPDEFLPAAEHYSLIEKIDTWVIENVLQFLSANPVMMDKIDFISVNLSGPSISSPKFLKKVIALFESNTVSPAKICFEITETVAISNMPTAKSFMSHLKKLGCRFSLDDFGSGFSSFGYLKNLPVDYIKIDGMFVRDITHNEFDLCIVKSINEVAQVLGMKTIAEYVENDEIRALLTTLGVDYFQGNGVSRAIPLEDVENSLL